eukprot:m.17076 g.17076  ORF g.17076 m.17076 type:complete len:297 (+) comp8094_c0_seq2:1013-1903(+)
MVRRKLWQKMLEESRQHVEQYGNDVDGFKYNYGLDNHILSQHLPKECGIFFMNNDEETRHFIEHCYERYAQCLPYVVDLFSLTLLRPFFSATSANAICNRGRMFVMSCKQLQDLLRLESFERFDRLLDIGAGDGFVTEKIACLFHHVDVTEVNRFMLWRLKSHHRTWCVHDTVSWTQTTYNYNVITCFNVLDRCEQPWKLLHDIKNKLKDGGHLVIALVLPYSAYIDDHGSSGRKPKSVLDIKGNTIEEHIISFYNNVAVPLEMELTAVARVPYLCEGDHIKPFYVLDDVIFVLRK